MRLLLFVCFLLFFFFKQKTAYEMRISDWSSDVCSSDLVLRNKLGIRDDNILKEREAFFSVVRHGELIVQRAMPATNAREYRELHNHLFQDVYDWAGRFRTVDISKPGSTFARAHFIARSMEHEFKQLPDLQTPKSRENGKG